MRRGRQGWWWLTLAFALGGLRCGGEEATEGAGPVRSRGPGGGGGQGGNNTGLFPGDSPPFPEEAGAAGDGGQGGLAGADQGGEAGEGGLSGTSGQSGAAGEAGEAGAAGAGWDCGDGACAGGESCQTCSKDCGLCPVACPNSICEVSESCASCPQDCGACPAEKCNDGVDNDLDGQVDEGCPTETKVYPKPSDDCVCLRCPPEFPYVKSCSLGFTATGEDPSSNSNCFEKRSSGTVYAMQGKNCGTSSDYQGKVTGYIVCAKSAAGATCSVGDAIACKSWPAAGIKDSYKNCD